MADADANGEHEGFCCSIMKDVLESEQFDPLISADDSGTFFMAVGVTMEDEGLGMFGQPIRFCPFCGTEFMSAEQFAALGDEQQSN